MKPLTHAIPARRDAKGNSLPKRFSHARPGVCADPEAILEITELAADDPKGATQAYPRLKARHALHVANNAVAVSQELLERLRGRNEGLEERAKHIEAKLEPLRKAADALDAKAADACAAAGCQLPAVGQRSPEPLAVSEDSIAAQHSFVIPRNASKAAALLLKLAATLGCGTVFGISCGLLSGSLYLEDLSSNPMPLALWSLLGTAIISLIGSTLAQLAGHVGEQHEWRAIRASEPSSRSVWPLLVITVVLGAVFTAIESQVEKLGILRSLREGQSFGAFSVTDGELFIVSLLLALPVVCWYIVEGFTGAIKSVRETFVAGELARHDREVRLSERYRLAAQMCVNASDARVAVLGLESELAEVKGGIRDDLTQTELEQIEDCEFDALVADWAAEDALLAQIGLEAPQERPKRAPRGFLGRAAAYFGRLLARQA